MNLTDEVADRIVDAIRRGTPLRFACEAAGVSYDTALRWLRIGHGATGDGWTPTPATRRRYEGFASAVERAQAEAVDAAVSHVERAGQGDWRAAAWLLERRWPETFGQKSTVKVHATIAELESELVDLVGPDKAGPMVLAARARVTEALGRAEPPAELPAPTPVMPVPVQTRTRRDNES